MCFTPYRSSTSSARSASSWLARASAAAPNNATELWSPVRPKGRCWIIAALLLRRRVLARELRRRTFQLLFLTIESRLATPRALEIVLDVELQTAQPFHF